MSRHADTDRPRGRRWVLLVAAGVIGLLAAVVVGGVGADSGDAGGAQGEAPANASAGETTGSPEPTASSSGSSSSSSSPPRPESPRVVARGNGHVVPIRDDGEDTWRPGREVRWSVEAEQGLGLDLQEFADVVRETLHDRRGWEVEDRVHFVQVSPAQVERGAPVDVRVTLASPATTDRLCAPLTTRGRVSCSWGDRAVINAFRWVKGAGTYRGDVAGYRTYVVNHEVGHSLGHAHEPCPKGGRRAPVMVQQTLSLGGCVAWPYPREDGSQRR